MATSKYNLDINKQAIIKPLVILRHGDYGIDTMHVSLAVANEPMDLTGATIKFMGTTANGSKIIDNEHVKIIDAHGGVFEYVFPSEAASDVGEYKVAYFSIVQANGQSSTMDFRVQVLSGVDITASEASGYISQYGTLVTKLNSAYDSATKATNQKMASTVSSLATSAATVLDSALARVNNVNSTANSASSAASRAVSMASSVATTVTSQASYINSVASSAVSNVSSVASSATSNVSSVAAGVVDKLNNISVGGRNYILNSSGKNASASNIPVLSGGNGDSASKIDLQADRIVMTNTNGSREFFYGLTSAFTDITNTPLIAGNTYTLSVKARGTSQQVALRVGFQNMNPVSAVGFTKLDNTKWTKATFTFTIPVGTPAIYMRLNGGINNQVYGFAGNETIEFKEVMLEQSNVASDWVPAPEDVDNKLSTRAATFTDFNDVAKNMVKYSGSWVIASQSIANSPLQYYYTAIITPGFTGGKDGYIELVPFASGSSKKYIAVVGSGKLSAWKSFAFDDDVVHKTGDTMTGNLTAPQVTATDLLTGFHNVIQVPNTTTSIVDLIKNDFIKGLGFWKEATFIAYNRVLSDAPTNDAYSIIKLATRGLNRTYVEYSDYSGNMWHTTAGPNFLYPWVKQANDSEVVHKTGNETIAGDKAFTGNTTLASTTILAGNYGLRVTPSGFQKTTDGRTWVSANI